jgi:hypothetical protein
MAKKEKKPAVGNYRRHGWLIDEKAMKDYAKITDANRKAAIVIGRIIYVFFPDNKSKFRYGGFMEIWPKLTKGMIQVSNHPVLPTHDFFATQDMETEDYKGLFEPLLTKKIAQGILYIKKEDKLVKYKKLEYGNKS